MQPKTRIPRRGFTLIEMLVVLVIIVLLASVALAALAKTREKAKEEATKATIAKLHAIIMQRIESYKTRRIPINVDGLTPAQAALVKLYALRDLMRMEMPERWSDVTNGPKAFTIGATVYSLPYVAPATSGGGSPYVLPLQKSYYTWYTSFANGGNADHAGAKCLYLWVMTAIPEARKLFTAAEVGQPDGDGWNMFIDGWGRPICWLRWAPGASGCASPASAPYSDIQVADPTPGPPNPATGKGGHHDPFDYRNVDPGAYQLFPLIYAGVISKDSTGQYDDYGISVGPAVAAGQTSVPPTLTPCTTAANEQVGIVETNGGPPLYSNHHITQE
jgi:prepilin-type N-terminal cleavage/methylation domain-containing protein